MGDTRDAQGDLMTRCGCIVRHDAAIGVDTVYYGDEAFSLSARQRSLPCTLCCGWLGRLLLLSFRDEADMLKTEIPKWAALTREDNLGASAGLPSSSKPKPKPKLKCVQLVFIQDMAEGR
jgi:hypothetical protein